MELSGVQEGKILGFLENYFKASKRGIWNQVLKIPLEDDPALQIDYTKVSRESQDCIDSNPTDFMRLAKVALTTLDAPTDFDYSNVPIRIVNYPYKTKISKLRSKHLTKFVSIEGTVRELSEVRPTDVKTAFRCLRCGHVTFVDQTGPKFEEPFAGCENETCGKKGPFDEDQSLTVRKDQQKIVIQENLDGLNGRQPSSIMVELDNELAGVVMAGDKITVSGPLMAFRKNTREGKTKNNEIFIRANSLTRNTDSFENLNITDEDIEQFKEFSKFSDIVERLVSGYAPHICGYEEEKLAILLMCFGGVRKEFADGAKTRGDINLLFVGDPGIAKSQLGNYVSHFAPRVIKASGKSTTSAGLTATVEKSEIADGKWSLKAGALVMANGDKFPGIVVMDEMDKCPPEHLSSLHDAMEEQVIHIAKASIVQDLNARCSILGIANPKDNRFDPYRGIAEQIGFPGSLLTRFDLIFTRQDVPNRATDSEIAQHILNHNLQGELIKQSNEELSDTPKFQEFIKKYIAYSKMYIFPVMSEEVIDKIYSEYMRIRGMYEGRSDMPIPLTARALETYIRLSEAAARMRLSQTVEMQDVKIAIKLMRFCLQNNGVDKETGLVDTDIIDGTSKSQKDKIKIMKQCIEELGTASLDEIKERCKFRGVESTLKKLSSKGEVFSPEKDIYKLVK